MSVFRKKTNYHEKTTMNRHLNLSGLILLGIGTIVGTGIFTVTGIGASTYAGPGLSISILIAAIAVALSAMILAEFASRISTGGGTYGYIYATLGEFPAWMTGWFMIITFVTAISSVASGWGAYLKGLLTTLGILLPTALNGSFNPSKGQYIDLLPVLVIILVTRIVLLDSKKALRFNNLLVILKFSALILFILIGLVHIDTSNWSNFIPFGFGNVWGGQTGIMAGSSLMFFAFLGFEALPMAVDDIKDPQHTLPRGITITVAVVAVLYISVTLILTGIVNYTQLNVSDAVSFALRSVGATWAATYVSTVAILTLITVCIALLYTLSRTMYSISQDGLLPQKLSQLNPKNKVPTNATLVASSVAILLAGFFPLETLSGLSSLVTLVYLAILPIALLKLRREEGLPTNDQFKTPLVPILPVLSSMICLSMIIQSNSDTWLLFILATGIGILIYLLYGYKHSKQARK